MRKQLFNSICNQLKLVQQNEDGNYIVAQTPDSSKATFRHFDLWNQQLDYLDEEQPFLTPAVFIEFLPINWRQQSQGVRDATIVINLHVVTRRIQPQANVDYYTGADALAFLDLLTAVNLCLHGHKGPQFGGLTGMASTTDNNADELMHSIEQYSTMVTDASARWPQQKVAASVKIE